MRNILKKAVTVICCSCLVLSIPCTSPSGRVEAQTLQESEAGPSCRIVDWQNVELKVYFATLPESDDGYFHVVAMNTYEYEITPSAEFVASKAMNHDMKFRFPLNHGKSNTRLYQKFGVAVKQQGKFVLITEPQYISNPEYLAYKTRERPKTTSKKGLLLDNANGIDLGVQHYITNMHAETGMCMTNILDAKGVKNVVVLNPWTENQDWINPLSRDNKKANYYMFNASDAKGVKLLADSFRLYATAYDYDNWIIGNEINARNPWNYTKYVPVEQYTREYMQAFRVMYTAIKSVNANAEIFISLDQNWNRDLNAAKTYYDARDVLECFNNMIISGGNIDYGVAFHPYPAPLYWAKVWDMAKVGNQYASLIQHTPGSPVVSFQNLHVLTDWLRQPQYLNPKGNPRKVILSEIGLNSRQGEDVQAAALVYAYVAAESDDLVESIIFSRGNDDRKEMKDNMDFGLMRMDGTPKISYQIFKTMDTDGGEQCMNYAKNVIGISNWSQVIYGASYE